MNRFVHLLALTAALVALLAAPAIAANAAHKGRGYRLRLPRGFQEAPSSRGTKLQARVQALMSGSGLPLTGSPKGRVFMRITNGEASTLLLLLYRIPEGSGLADGAELNADQLQRAWDIAVGASGREAVRDVRKEKLNALHTGVKATLVESLGGGVTTSVRLAVAAAHGQILVLAYDAQAANELDNADAWEGVLSGLRLVVPGRDWSLYLRYGAIVAAGLVLLMAGWWLVLRPRGGIHPGRLGKADTQIRSADGIGTFQHASEAVSQPPSFLRPKELTNPLDIDPFAADGEPRRVDPLPMPSVGEDWDPENDPAFAFEEEEEPAPRPQVDYNQVLAPKASMTTAEAPPAAPRVPTPARVPTPDPESTRDAATGAGAPASDDDDEDMSEETISRNLDFLFGE